MAFFQEPPRLGNQLREDALLQEYLARALPPDELAPLAEELDHLGELSGGRLWQMRLAERLEEPRLTQWDPWGHRVDDIAVTPLWREMARLAAEHGFVATAYERKQGPRSRVAQFSKIYVTDGSSDVYSCPLAMTDGATRTLLDLKNQALIERAVPSLTSRDPARMWTSGQWMTERTGGSDVGLTETVARKDGEAYRLYGTKWFTSAITSQMALTLARPEGNGPGGKGLALFYLEIRQADGRLNGIAVNRLKDKLGTRKVPTAELTLDGAWATPVAGLTDGIRNISSMLNVTRTWNAICAVSWMRRALALARDYARRRVAFGAPLAQKPLHVDTMAQLQAEYEGAFLLAFRAAELMGKREGGEASDEEQLLFRCLTPIAKLMTGKQAVALVSEVAESFGGAGYVEDTGVPALLRDAQVLPIWEGTTNVLSLDTLRALSQEGAFGAVEREVERNLAEARVAAIDGEIRPAADAARAALARAGGFLARHLKEPEAIEASGRRIATTLARALELSLVVRHAAFCAGAGKGNRAAAAARRLALDPAASWSDFDRADAQLLAAG